MRSSWFYSSIYLHNYCFLSSDESWAKKAYGSYINIILGSGRHFVLAWWQQAHLALSTVESLSKLYKTITKATEYCLTLTFTSTGRSVWKAWRNFESLLLDPRMEHTKLVSVFRLGKSFIHMFLCLIEPDYFHRKVLLCRWSFFFRTSIVNTKLLNSLSLQWSIAVVSPSPHSPS